MTDWYLEDDQFWTIAQKRCTNFFIFHPQSIVNVKPEVEETEEEKEAKHKTFVEKYEKQIKHFGKHQRLLSIVICCLVGVWDSCGSVVAFFTTGMLRRWDDSQKYLSDNPHLVCEETANYLVIMCIDLEVEEVKTNRQL